MRLFTLLYLNEHEKSMHNGRQAKNFKAQMELYVGCILNLRNSLKQESIKLTVLTNNVSLLKSMTDTIDLDIIEIEFSLKVPTGLNFYADHFKADVYKYFSTLSDPYVGLIDNDVVAINKMPIVFREMISALIPTYYDITAEIHPAYGQEVVLGDKQRVAPDNKIGLWAGGEFIAGPPVFFDLLRKEIMEIIESYFSIANQLHHQSVEFLTSVAVEKIILQHKCAIVDAGRLGIISRYWNANTLHVQNDLDAFTHSFLLHLPADKPMLAKAGRSGLTSEIFLQKYKKVIERENNSYSKLKKSVKQVLNRN